MLLLSYLYVCIFHVLLISLKGVGVYGGWKDHNQVLVDGHWKPYPLEYLGNPFPPVDDKWKDPDSKIVILIAALRETRLPETILSAFNNAKFPDRIFIGVVQQNAESDEDTVAAVCRQREKPERSVNDISFGRAKISTSSENSSNRIDNKKLNFPSFDDCG